MEPNPRAGRRAAGREAQGAVSHVRSVALALIVGPDNPVRSEMDDEALDELAADIKTNGLLQPVGLLPRPDKTFEVVWGDRRVRACRKAGLADVLAVIVEDKARVHAARIAENFMREDVSPADEALYLADLYAEVGEDVDAVCELVKRGRNFVEGRLLLLRGDRDVFEALRTKRISLAAAEGLNKCKRPEDRAYLLDCALKAGGISAREIARWVAEFNGRAELAALTAASNADDSSQGTGVPAPQPRPLAVAAARPWELSSSLERRRCLACGEEHAEHEMFRQFVCEGCRLTFVPSCEERWGG